jgi:hypothetical protein
MKPLITPFFFKQEIQKQIYLNSRLTLADYPKSCCSNKLSLRKTVYLYPFAESTAHLFKSIAPLCHLPHSPPQTCDRFCFVQRLNITWFAILSLKLT